MSDDPPARPVSRTDHVPVELWALCVRTARRRVGLSQGELAAAADVTQQTISKVEAGTMCAHDTLKVRLASALDLPLEALFPWPPKVLWAQICDLARAARSGSGERAVTGQVDRGQVVDSIRTRALVIVDDAGNARVRLGVMADGTCRFALLDVDGFERIGLTAGSEVSTIDLTPRTRFDHGTRVRMYAHDPGGGAEFAVGVHLVVRGDAVAGFEVVEGRAPDVWTS